MLRVASPIDDGPRRIVVRLLFLFYVLLLAEGPLRKWVLPGASNALVFLRDPVMVALLIAYARLGASRQARPFLLVFAAFVLAILACVVAQVATTAVPGLAVVAGLRNYLLFVPLACIVGDAFSPRDYAAWIRLNLGLAGPVAALVVLQYRADPSAAINAVPGGGNDGVFLVVDDVVRPYGLFSFTLGHSAFAAWMLGVVLAAAVGRRSLRIGPGLLAWGGVSAVAMVAFSGSRTCLLLAASVLAVFFAATATTGRPAERWTSLALAACGAGALAAVVLIQPAVVTDLLDRQANATASEGATADRVFSVVTDFADELRRTPGVGLGLGAGTNIANYLSSGRTEHRLAEYGLTRIVQELGPFFGLVTILLRWLLVGWFATLTVRALRRGNLQPSAMLGFVAPVFAVHDITLQNSMIGIGWFSAGVLLSAVRAGPAPVSAPSNLVLRGVPSCA